jgi:hypothetical protein
MPFLLFVWVVWVLLCCLLLGNCSRLFELIIVCVFLFEQNPHTYIRYSFHHALLMEHLIGLILCPEKGGGR